MKQKTQKKNEKFDLCYLGTLDGGNGSIRWPQEAAEAANNLQISVYDQELSTLLKMNLLWRPFVTIRHLELFDNLAFAKFLKRHKDECQDLAESGLLRLCAPSVEPIAALVEKWMLGRGPQFPMHWHHLNSERQKAYDSASLTGKLKAIDDVRRFLFLDEHHLDLGEMITRYQRIFSESGIIELGPPRPTEPASYAERVQQKWGQYLRDRKQQGLRMPNALNWIENTLKKCQDQNGRRRTYYTELRYLRDTLAGINEGQRFALDHAIAETKSFVLNDAYYDEFEGFTTARVKGKSLTLDISVNRDISKVWMPEETIEKTVMRRSDPEPLVSTAFAALESVDLSDILHCHTAPHSEAESFRKSIDRLYGLGIMSSVRRETDSKIAGAVRDHIEVMRACLTRVLRDAKKPDVMRDSIAQVYLGGDPGIMGPVFGSGIGLAGMAYFAHGLPGALTLLLGPTIAVLVRKKTLTYKWKIFEAALAKHIQSKP
ncbi:MAG TPA: hypothetical protein VGK24_14815 [Candidatus Angelobacter sp.]